MEDEDTMMGWTRNTPRKHYKNAGTAVEVLTVNGEMIVLEQPDKPNDLIADKDVTHWRLVPGWEPKEAA